MMHCKLIEIILFFSIAGMVASRDRNAFCYNIGCTSQDRIKTTFRSNFMENLNLFRQANGCLPIKLIYFRNDESGSSSNKAIESERKAMLEACREVHEGHEKEVKITIIIVEKERHMRLFARSNDDKVSNVPPGTIFDTFIAHQHKKQFYMVSQQAIEGVTRPTKYTIFMDQANHCIYDLQQLTYFVSFNSIYCINPSIFLLIQFFNYKILFQMCTYF